jgi:Sulfotransferase family
MSQAPALPQPFRPFPIRAANAVGRGLARWGARPIALDEASLERAASRANGDLADFGEESFRPGLHRLIESLETDARLSLFGRYFARRQLLELLGQRLVLTDHRKRHPEVAQEEIRRPLFILGLPRTGTTLLYGLLAEDPAHRKPLSWEIDDPCPPAESASYDSDPRVARTEKRFEQLRRLAPGFQAIHPIGALMPQECIVITAPEFMSVRFEMCFDVAGYQEWLVDQDMTPTYRFHRRFLQHMQSRHKAERWVVKSPGHLGPIDSLFEVYPDALVVQTHRDPIRVVPSVASLEYTLRLVSSDEVDPIRLGRQQLRLWSTLLEQGVAARARHPEREQRILDLRMSEIVSDPIGCMHRIYARFELELSNEVEARMRDYLARHPRDEFGSHRYSLAAFGLDEASVNAAYKGYRERFGVEPEPYA